MKKIAITLITLSLFGLAACKEDKQNEAQIAEAQAILKEANALLSEARQTKAQAQMPQYQGWLQACVTKRDEAESTCTEKEAISEQAACLVVASKVLGVCMAENGLSSVQETIITQGAALSEILGRSAAELEKWAEDNGTNLNDIAQGLAPFIEGLSAEGDDSLMNNPLLKEFLNNFAGEKQ